MADCRVLIAECSFPRVTSRNPQGYPDFSTGLTRDFLRITPFTACLAASGLALSDLSPMIGLQSGIRDLHCAQEQRGLLGLNSAADDLFHDLLHRELEAFTIFQHLHSYFGILLIVDGACMEDTVESVAHCGRTTRLAGGFQV